MTELQDEICDALVGAKITRLWECGPLHTAALIIDPGFAFPGQSARRPRRLAKVLGWPTLFCSAVATACGRLADEDDRRSFAITLFANVNLPHPGRFIQIAPGVGGECATWAALRVHPIACGEDCPLLIAARKHVDGHELSTEWWQADRSGRCRSSSPLDAVAPRPGSYEAYLSLVSLGPLLTSPQHNQEAKSYVVAHASRAEAAVRGVAGAVEFCLTLAEKLGLKPAPGVAP